MWEISIVIGLFILVSSIILPWVNRSSISELRDTVERLQTEVAQLRRGTLKAEVPKPTVAAPRVPEPVYAAPELAPVAKEFSPEESIFVSDEDWQAAPQIEHPAHAARVDVEAVREPEAQSFEQRFGGQAFVWLGGIALALAGVFMVKYSIETGLLSPAVRVVLGLILGASLLGGGAWMRRQPDFANGTRISQALSGAGIADLYATIFAATSLYHLVPSFLGFTGLAAVTATAVMLSLRHGVPIALLGLVGGFLTPALVGSSSPSAPLLFLYLYFVLTGFMVVIRKQNWWFMAIPTVLAAFVWIPIWLFGGNFEPNDTLWLGLFLAAVSVTVIGTSRDRYAEEYVNSADNPVCILNYLTLGGAFVLMGVTAGQSGFGLMEWGFFGLLSLGGIGLAFFNPRLYGLAPWLSLGVNAVMLLSWQPVEMQHYALTLAAFAALYIGSGFGLQSISALPFRWAGLTAASSLGYYLLGYFKLHDTALFAHIPYFWGGLALAFAGASLCVLQKLMRTMPKEHEEQQKMFALYAALTTAFLSIGLSIELKREFLSVAFAAEMAAIAWINTRVDIRALRSIAMLLACVFGFLLVPQILLLVQLTAYSLVEAHLSLQDSVPIVNWPVFQLGLPAVFFLGGAYALRKQQDDRLVRALEVSGVALIGVMGYYLTRHAFHVHENVLFVKAGFIERSVITNILFAYGLACLAAGRFYGRTAISVSGLVLSAVAVFRLCYFDFFIANPLWSAQAVGATVIVNGLLLTYGLPVAWIALVNRELPHLDKAAWSKYGNGFMLLLVFTLVSLNVRQFFHGTYLNGHMTSDGEIYTYSVVWLLLGIGLLFVGTLRDNRLIRTASLPVLLLTVGKVFLFDASELTGLWRVFSFFGLGLSLLALSWFYSRFVFREKTPKIKRT